MVPSIVFELLEHIHKYYPIGLPQIAHEHKGYADIKNRIAVKVNEIIENKKTRWTTLIEDIKKAYPYLQVSDFGHLQFPNYLVSIEVEKNETKQITYTKSLVLCISLLVDYYTVYFEDLVRIKDKEEGYDHAGSLNYDVVYFNSCKERDCFEKGYLLKKLAGQAFSTKKFVDHKILYDYKILGGAKYGDEYNSLNESTIFQFLFNNDELPSEILD